MLQIVSCRKCRDTDAYDTFTPFNTSTYRYRTVVGVHLLPKKLPPNRNIHVVICVWMAFNKLINLLAENNTVNTFINTLIPHRLYR